MNAQVRKKPAGKELAIRFDEMDPESLSGQYRRRFWHPIYITADLEPGKFQHVSFLLEFWNDVGYATDMIAGMGMLICHWMKFKVRENRLRA